MGINFRDLILKTSDRDFTIAIQNTKICKQKMSFREI
jgi:hypothetical protein